MPKIHQKLMLQLGFESQESIKYNFWNKAQWFEVSGENHIGKISLLFSKVEDQTVEAQVEKLQQSIPTQPNVKPIKPMINFEDFTKLDLRIAHVESCKKVEKADKLLQLELNIGGETRTVLSGIAEHFSPEEVEGRDVLYLANLAPRKIRGIESQGMVLLAENEEGKLQFVKPDGAIEPGSTVA
jgi:methionyl-tRNA synthetase